MLSSEKNSEFWQLVSKYRRSKRGEVLQELVDTARNSSEIADRLDIKSNTAGNYLREAKRDDLVQCVTPDADRYKMYQLTDQGRELAKEM